MDDREQPAEAAGVGDAGSEALVPVVVELQGLLARVQELIRTLPHATPGDPRADPDLRAAFERLTPRQLQFVHLACDARELTTKQIAHAMGVCESTVDKCWQAVRRRIGVKTRQGLYRAAQKAGLVKP